MIPWWMWAIAWGAFAIWIAWRLWQRMNPPSS